jgi:hypothetical protein
MLSEVVLPPGTKAISGEPSGSDHQLDRPVSWLFSAAQVDQPAFWISHYSPSVLIRTCPARVNW